MESVKCAHCGRAVPANPRIKNQTHCSRKACRRDKKRLWQRQKMATDPEYRANQRDCWNNWRERNPQYWKEYRRTHPEAEKRNRLKQKERNGRRIAKMDSSDPVSEVKPGTYYLVPEEMREQVIAKMDTLIPKITLILMPYEAIIPPDQRIAKEDSIDPLTS